MIIRSHALYESARVDAVEDAIVQMEQNGFLLDVDYCRSQAAIAQADEARTLDSLADWLRACGAPPEQVASINWASPTQVTKLLHDDLGLPPSPVWKKGRVNLQAGERKLDEAALDWIHGRAPAPLRPGLRLLVALRRIRGSIKYLTKLPNYVGADGLVHPVSGPSSDGDSRAGTITWRLACKNPEVMQIPTQKDKDPYRIRRAFIAPPGHTLLVADEKALEVVILAHLLIALFDDHQLADMLAPGAPDIHSVNARRVFGDFLKWERHGRPVSSYPYECFQSSDYPELQALRQDIKAVWYGLMYGKSAYGFATSLRDANDNPIGEKIAGAIIDALFTAIPGVPRYQGFIGDYVVCHHGIPGLGGAWCDLSAYTKSGDEWGVKRAIRIAQNYPCQEGGARIIGRAMADITRDMGLWTRGLRIERQVHDEFDFRLPVCTDDQMRAVIDRIRYHMTSYPLHSQLQVSIGQGSNWDDAG